MRGGCAELGGSLLLPALARVLLGRSKEAFGWGFPMCFRSALALVYGAVFKVQDFSTYVVYLGIVVVWNGISAALGSAPNLFEHNQAHVQNTNLNPIFYVLEEWAFQVQTFLQSFILVLLALSFFQHNCSLTSWLVVGCHC